MHIAFIGAGNFGKAVSVALAKKNTVQLWDSVPGKVLNQSSVTEVVQNADIVFLAVPSLAVRQASAEIAAHLKPNAIVVSVSKSLEAGTRMTADKILEETLSPNQPIAFMGGPMLAAEIAQGKSAIAVCGTKHRSHFAIVKKAFKKSGIRIEHSSDVSGVAICGVLKNIYTLPIGIASGLDLGNNTVGWLAARGFTEMQKLLPILGGKKKTLLSTAGIGDFVATSTSPHSMNHKAGEEIAKNGKTDIRSEGMVALPTLISILGGDLKKFPVLKTLNEVVQQQVKPSEAFHELITGIK
jgi:glycerol-3-phosphate dehydrogenase (NAD(P)+)